MKREPPSERQAWQKIKRLFDAHNAEILAELERALEEEEGRQNGNR